MDKTTLQAEVRESRGKGPARRLRMQGKLPAVFYGPGIDPTPLTVDPKDVRKSLGGEYGRNTLFELAFGDKAELAMVREVIVEPVGRELVHVDFYRVSLDREVAAEIPFSTTGRAVGVVKGGKLNVVRRSLPVRCTPNKIPSKIVVDVSGLDMFETFRVKDLKLADGITVALDPEQTLATVGEDRRAQQDAADAAAAAATTAAAPAAAKPDAK